MRGGKSTSPRPPFESQGQKQRDAFVPFFWQAFPKPCSLNLVFSFFVIQRGAGGAKIRRLFTYPPTVILALRAEIFRVRWCFENTAGVFTPRGPWSILTKPARRKILWAAPAQEETVHSGGLQRNGAARRNLESLEKSVVIRPRKNLMHPSAEFAKPTNRSQGQGREFQQTPSFWHADIDAQTSAFN